MPDFLFKGLNEVQQKAVLHTEGPLLVLAGAGAGKTKAIAHRVAHLVSKGTEPERILAITFTNKAAKEMKERINSLLKIQDTRYKIQGSPFVSTFHSLGVYILKRSGKPVGVGRNFTIFDKEDSLSAVKDAMAELNIDPKQFVPGKMQSVISRYKGDLITEEEFSSTAGGEFFPRMVSQIWSKYEEILKKHNALDFDDLILKTVILLKKDKQAREHYQNLWKYILIDEYQDTNKVQYELSKILSAKHKNICVIGDIDQAIYGWRGADFRNIINFENDFPEFSSVVFEKNYRSTQTILEAAAKVIEKNKMRKEKKLVAEKDAGAEISLFEAMNEEEEAEFVVHKIKELLKKKGKKPEIAVLYRANFQSRILEEFCLRHGVPYQVLGTQFYQRKEIKDIFAFLRSAINPDNLLDVKRIINVPPRGIGKTTILNYFAHPVRKNISNGTGKKIPTDKEKKLDDFLKLLSSIKEKINSSKASDAVKFVMRETGYQKFLQEGGDDDKERLENIKELVSIASRYDSLKAPEGVEKMIEDASLMSDQDSMENKTSAVRLMTAHSAKGLEFDCVFVVGMEEGLFPHSGFGASSDEKEEEERRLFYVAITRAKEKLFLSFSLSRTVFGAKQLNLPSKFLSDIPEHLIKLEEYDKKEEIIEYD